MPKHISEERKTAYYVGMGLIVLGGLLFASTIVTFLMYVGDPAGFSPHSRSAAIRAFGGLGLMFVGALIRGIGAQGLAGSGVLLDPERARDELEPYSRMAGGMLKDAIDEAGINLGKESEKVIMLKCRSCESLNQESAKFCQECGAKL